MIKLVFNANNKIKKDIFEDSVRSYYLSVCERYAKGYINTFITDMQILITKLGIMISNVSTTPIHISFCFKSLNYLCCDVLENPRLRKTFTDIGLNDKGNDGKHEIARNVKIDMDKWVSTYNTLVKNISSKYNLPALNDMIIKKKVSASINTKTSNIKNPPTQNKVSRPASTHQTVDNNVKLTATLEKGEGRYSKGLLFKTKMLNFNLTTKIYNPKEYRIVSLIAYIKGKHGLLEKKLTPASTCTTSFDVESDKFGGHIEVTVELTYKLSLFKTAQPVKVTISKDF